MCEAHLSFKADNHVAHPTLWLWCQRCGVAYKMADGHECKPMPKLCGHHPPHADCPVCQATKPKIQ